MTREKPTGSRKTVDTKNAKHLLPNERIPSDGIIVKLKASDEDLNSRYVKGDVRIVTESARYSLAGILSMLSENVEIDGPGGKKELRYKLDPEYQRRHRWSTVRKSRLIESFLMNVPVPPVFLYERDLARFEVMDGRQRLTALSEFYADKFALEGLEYWSDLDGRTYSKLPSKVRDGIDRRYISSIILLKETAATEEQATMLKKIVFERLNSGGVELGSQETRNAVYNGDLNQLCLSLSENESFRRMWGIPIDPMASANQEMEPTSGETEISDVDSTASGKRMFEKMEDVELVLRFFAYRHVELFKAGLNRISDSLDRFLALGNRFPQDVFASYREMFEATIAFLWSALGSDAYCVLGHSRSHPRPTKIVFDPIMFVANSAEVRAAYSELILQRDLLQTELKAMYEKESALFSGRRTNFVDTQQRNEVVKKAFAAAIAKLKRA